MRSVADGDLFFNVIPQKTDIAAADTLLLKIEITNIGKDVVLIAMDDLCLNPYAGLSLSVTDKDSKPIKMSVPLTCIPDTAASDRERFVRLAPDAIYGRLIRLQGSRIAPKPGAYLMTFTLRGTVAPKRLTQIFAVNPADKTTITVLDSQSTPLIARVPIHLRP